MKGQGDFFKIMKKNKIIAIFALITVLLIGATCYLIYRYLSPSRGAIYVFNDNYPAGTQVTKDILTAIRIDSTIIDGGRNGKIEDQFITPQQYEQYTTAGDTLRMDVAKGMPITPSMMSQIGGSMIEMNMQSESVAVTISVNNITGVTNELQPGTKVNIYSVMDDGVRLILQNMRILATYYSGESLSGVSIETQQSEAMKLIYAASYGSIYLGLIDGSGYQQVEDESALFYGGTRTIEAAADDTGFDYSDILDMAEGSDNNKETETSTQQETKQEETAKEETDSASGPGYISEISD